MTTTTVRRSPAIRGTRAYSRELRADLLTAAVFLIAATGIALMIADGALNATGLAAWITVIARAFGIVAAVMMMTQVFLAARDPFIERVFGHDRLMALHTQLGMPAILLMISHAALLLTATSMSSGMNIFATSFAFFTLGWWMAFAQVGLVVFLLVGVASMGARQKKIPYDRFRVVHLLVYVAIALAIPHQFLEGTTFAWAEPTAWFWAILWVASVGSFVTYRLGRPLLLKMRHHPEVASVVAHPDGATSVTITGRNLERLGAKPGQFFLFAFGPRGGPLSETHPFSLSAAPSGTLRISAQNSGDGSGALAQLEVGTPVWIEGPLGIFRDDARDGDRVILVAAGIGITPIRSMVEALPVGTNATVVLRARDETATLVDEVTALAQDKGFELAMHLGPRGESWGSASNTARLKDHITHPATTDVYVCGPVQWAQLVADEALALGVPPHAIHRERFGWL